MPPLCCNLPRRCTRHGRPLIGGYLSRVSERRKRDNMRLPMLRALIARSHPVMTFPSQWLEEGRAARIRFLARSCAGFEVIDTHRATPALRAYAREALNLSQVTEDERYQLLVALNPPPCAPPRGALAAD